MIFFQTDLCTK